MDKFVILNDAIPNIIYDIRYYSKYNFVGKRIKGYEDNIAIVTKECYEALVRVNNCLNKKGFCLKIYDAYRPRCAVEHFINWAKDINDTKMKNIFYPNLDKSVLFKNGYISDKSSHTRGSTVDLTIVDLSTKKELDMGGYFDLFDESSHFNYDKLKEEQINNRNFLRETMISFGFNPLEEEWWHFTLKNEPYPDTYFNFLVNKNIFKNH